MGYEKYYPGGWQSGEAGGTPITPEALNHMEEGIESAAENIDTHKNDKSNPHGVTAAQVGAAASSHNHSTSNITSGTLGVARGGTGKATHTSNAVLTGNGTSAVKNVATASGAFYATAANGAPTFGTLPIAQGGTGSTSAAAACTALGLSPVKNAGTEYTTREKFLNKTVYCRVVNCGAFTKGKTTDVAIGASARIIRFEGFVGYNSSYDYSVQTQKIAVGTWADGNTIQIKIASDAETRADTVTYVAIYYYKA